MAGSRSRSPIGMTPLEMAILTPGPLGHNDYASPESHSFPGDTPGPVGMNDFAARRISACLESQRSPELTSKVRAVMTPAPGAHVKLNESDFIAAASALGADISVAIIKAFAEVESGGRSGFRSDGLPVIAFEGHIFRRLTKKRHDASHPLLSYKYVTKAGPEWRRNNRTHTASWETLRAAMEIDLDAALQSCSWGMFQIMGFNFTSCGFSTVSEFVSSMKAGERGQLRAFVSFCNSRKGLARALAERDYETIAVLYNGEDYGNYDKLIERSYNKYAAAL